MKMRTVLYADEDTVLTNGVDFGRVIWLAEGVSPDTYHAIAMEEYNAILAAQEAQILGGVGAEKDGAEC